MDDFTIFYTSVMLHVAWITLDEAEWMILQFLHYHDAARRADHSRRRDVARRADHSTSSADFFYTSVMLYVARITLDDAKCMTLQFLHYRDVVRRADHSGRRRMDDFTIFTLA